MVTRASKLTANPPKPIQAQAWSPVATFKIILTVLNPRLIFHSVRIVVFTLV
mgnify:CR=1 FL=1